MGNIEGKHIIKNIDKLLDSNNKEDNEIAFELISTLNKNDDISTSTYKEFIEYCKAYNANLITRTEIKGISNYMSHPSSHLDFIKFCKFYDEAYKKIGSI